MHYHYPSNAYHPSSPSYDRASMVCFLLQFVYSLISYLSKAFHSFDEVEEKRRTFGSGDMPRKGLRASRSDAPKRSKESISWWQCATNRREGNLIECSNKLKGRKREKRRAFSSGDGPMTGPNVTRSTAQRYQK
mmetsp:Transcript_13769/g.20511  ORF Transcript_13769/g.20511 Transcript_13769/m.20511 type:complete len:134 (-) Transcript_13769:446-847(-)